MSFRRPVSPAAARPSSTGQALAEFALVLLVLMLIVMGIVDLSRAVYIRSVVANAAREGARYAIVHPDATKADIEASVKRLAVGMDEGAIGIQVIPDPPDLDTSHVQVVVTYTYHPATLLIAQSAGIGPGGIELRGSSRMRRE